MVGPAFLISPVLEAGAERLEVYFPGGGADTVWYDYWTGKRAVFSDSRRLSLAVCRAVTAHTIATPLTGCGTRHARGTLVTLAKPVALAKPVSSVDSLGRASERLLQRDCFREVASVEHRREVSSERLLR
jgi:hypothetical protein